MRLLMVATRIAREETRIHNPSSPDSELLLPPDKMRLLAVVSIATAPAVFLSSDAAALKVRIQRCCGPLRRRKRKMIALPRRRFATACAVIFCRSATGLDGDSRTAAHAAVSQLAGSADRLHADKNRATSNIFSVCRSCSAASRTISSVYSGDRPLVEIKKISCLKC